MVSNVQLMSTKSSHAILKHAQSPQCLQSEIFMERGNFMFIWLPAAIKN